MSLVGNLEDLGLGDILQIVSLSRKSGVLVLNSRGREGKVVFLNGQVIRATSSQFGENLGDLLLRKGLITVEVLKKAVFIQRNSERPPRLGAILADKFAVPQAEIEAAVKEQIEKIVYSFFAWDQGSFAFELGEPGELATTSFSPLQFMLDQGLNPQWLAMEGSRILDEMRHRGESFEEESSEPGIDLETLLGEPSPPARAAAVNGEAESEAVLPVRLAPTAGGPLLYLVDDDGQTGELLSAFLREQGFSATAFDSGRDFLTAIARAVAAGEEPLLLIDMIMPRLDGSGILGGLELLDQVRRRFPALCVVMMSDHPNSEATERARRLGVAEVLVKPKRGELGSPHGQGQLAHIGESLAVHAGLSGPSQEAGGVTVDLGAELLQELGVEAPAVKAGQGQKSPGLHLLRGMLQELQSPALGGGIILLVLRFASEIMNRAVVFFVKDELVVGLGQFGIESQNGNADARVREIAIPLNEESVFSKVVTEMVPLRTRLGSGRWDNQLRQQLGGGNPAEVFIGPIFSEGKVVAVLYGDNYPSRDPIGETESLEIFLSQAGLAMEKALLERRLRSRDGQ